MNCRNLVLPLCLVLVLILFSTVGFATSLYVNGSATTCAAGTNFPTIQEAINSASTGDSILICSNGTAGYKENVKLNKSGLSLVGNDSSVLINGSTLSIEINESNNFLSNLNVTTASTSNLCIYGHDVNNITLYYGAAFDCSNAIYLQSVNNSIVFGFIINNSDFGIQFNDGWNNTIYSNQIYNSGTDGIYNDGFADSNITFNTIQYQTRYAIESYLLVNVNISNNTINYSTTNSGIYIDSANSSEINNNNIQYADGNAIEAYTLSDVMVNGNIISHTDSSGIYVDTATSSFFNSNYMLDISGNGFELSSLNQTLVNENTILNTSSDSIYGEDIDATSFISNYVENSDYGCINLNSLTNGQIVGNTLLNCDDGYGIYLNSGSNNNSISNNTLNNTYDDGIYLTSSYFNNLSNNVISFSGDDGIEVSGSSNNQFSSNTIYSIDSDGLNINDGSANNSFSDDTIYDADVGIHIYGGLSNTFDSEVVYDCGTGFEEASSGSSGDQLSIISNSHFYDNGWDLWANIDGSDLIFTVSDTTLGDSTVISLNDTSDVSDYKFSGITSPAATPAGYVTFHNKYLATMIDGSSIDSFTFHWTNSETSGFSESSINLQQYDGASWSSKAGQTLDTAANTLTVTNLTEEDDSTYDLGLFATAAAEETGNHGNSLTFNLNQQLSCQGSLKITAFAAATKLAGVSIRLVQTDPVVKEIDTKTTSTEGSVTFTLPEFGKYNIYATKGGYTSIDDDLAITYGATACPQTVPQPNPSATPTTPSNPPTTNPSATPIGPSTPATPVISAPDQANTGTTVPVVVTNCPDCNVIISGPDGSVSNIVPDSSGKINFPLDKTGTYTVSLMRNGQTIKTINVQALANGGPNNGPSINDTPKNPVPIPSNPTPAQNNNWFWLVLLLLIILIAAGLYYWNSRRNQ